MNTKLRCVAGPSWGFWIWCFNGRTSDLRTEGVQTTTSWRTDGRVLDDPVYATGLWYCFYVEAKKRTMAGFLRHELTLRGSHFEWHAFPSQTNGIRVKFNRHWTCLRKRLEMVRFHADAPRIHVGGWKIAIYVCYLGNLYWGTGWSYVTATAIHWLGDAFSEIIDWSLYTTIL
jgi:hypothetical protein